MLVPPIVSEEEFQKVLMRLDKILPGKGNIAERFIQFRKKFEIPKDKISKVFDAALNECKKRTSKFIQSSRRRKF